MAKMAGNKIIAIGIKNLKLWSKVNEITTQYRLNKKYPNPKYHPYLKRDLLLDIVFFFFKMKIKNNENVIKLIIK